MFHFRAQSSSTFRRRMAAKGFVNVLEVEGEDQLQLKEAIARSLKGKVLHIVIVGCAGAGKSTLANTLLGEEVFEERHSVPAVTGETARGQIELDIEGKGKVTVVIHDTPGITGGRKNDKIVDKEWRKFKTFDLLLICIAMDADGGRYIPNKVNPVFNKIEEIYGDDLKSSQAKFVLVLTRANLASKLIREQAEKDRAVERNPLSFTRMVQMWKEEHKEEREGSLTANLPILIAGRLVMDEKTRKPVDVSRVANSKEWLDKLWCDICKPQLTSPELTVFLYAWRKKILADPDIPVKVKQAAERSTSSMLENVIRILRLLAALPLMLRWKYQADKTDWSF